MEIYFNINEEGSAVMTTHLYRPQIKRCGLRYPFLSCGLLAVAPFLKKNIAGNADGYGKWANLPISNDKGFDHLLYPMLPAVKFAVYLY